MVDQFEGFEDPKENWSKLPHSLIAALPLVETLGELEVILYILRHTWGFQDDEKKITLDEFANGRKRKDGSRLDEGTGLTIPTIRNGIKRAMAHGFIERYRDDSDLGRVKNFYTLKMRGEKSLHPDLKKFTGRGKEVLPRTEKETLETNKGNDTFDSLQEASENDNLPTAHDNHQRAIDQANGGGDLDPNEEVAKHHYWGLMGGPVPLPTGKREYKKWYETGKTILNRLPQPWDLERILAIIDQLWETEWDSFYQRMPCKEEAVDIFVSKIVRQLQNGHGFTPTPAAEVQARLDAGPPEDDPLGDLWAELLPQVIFQFGELRGSQLLERDNGRLKVLVKNPQAGAMDHLDRGREVIKRALGVQEIEFVEAAA